MITATDKEHVRGRPIALIRDDDKADVCDSGVRILAQVRRVGGCRALPQCGARLLLAEKNRRAGVKILMSGGTRCNITNARGLRRLDVVSGPVDPAYEPMQSRGIRAIQRAFGENGRFLASALQFDVDATIRMFEEAGVSTKIEANGKIFPVSDKAAEVLDALVQRVEHSGAELRCVSPVAGNRDLGAEQTEGSRFAINLPATPSGAKRDRRGGRTVLSGMGTTGDGYRSLASLAIRSWNHDRRWLRSVWGPIG